MLRRADPRYSYSVADAGENIVGACEIHS